jgi:hypothetical protein
MWCDAAVAQTAVIVARETNGVYTICNSLADTIAFHARFTQASTLALLAELQNITGELRSWLRVWGAP